MIVAELACAVARPRARTGRRPLRAPHPGHLRARRRRDRRRELVRAQAAPPDAGRRRVLAAAPSSRCSRDPARRTSTSDRCPWLRGRHSAPGTSESGGTGGDLQLAGSRASDVRVALNSDEYWNPAEAYVPGTDGYSLDDTSQPGRSVRDAVPRRQGDRRGCASSVGPAPVVARSQGQARVEIRQAEPSPAPDCFRSSFLELEPDVMSSRCS